ncbi:NADH-quinone oxidoreductase subunit C [Bacillus mangrovi]|uniref:NADH-quinone oxidoreductase n=1 Tax=Metabacillus mangrovi TaxID=1491830 RepID=A0A7X2S5Q9_9BACI|nr:NADH-quinone oxidoreductase subunit C [Metabacillus mangrovi]MTH54005.1 NADH-quinone oxidoreductase subunit C [Metabacillus mangrovi]
MADGKSLEQLKKEAAEKARQAAKEKLMQENPAEETAASAEAAEEASLALAKKKAAAAAKAKAAALAKQKRMESEGSALAEASDDLAKKKAAAAAKAKAAALAKQKRMESDGSAPAEASDDLAKQKAAAAAKAKAAAAAKAKAVALAKSGQSSVPLSDEEKAKAKAVAAAKAKAAAAAKAKLAANEAEEPEEEVPSVHQPRLERTAALLSAALGPECVQEASINRLSKEVPTITVAKEHYLKAAALMRRHEDLACDYLSEMHATDFQTHMEIYLYLYSYTHRQSIVLKTKVDRDNPEVDSVAGLWRGADWPEREAYDLLGIHFVNHPNLKRIMLPDEWVGHPLRKDYEPYDVEV